MIAIPLTSERLCLTLGLQQQPDAFVIRAVTIFAALGDVGVVLLAMLLLVILLPLLVVTVNVGLLQTKITVNQLRYAVTNDTT